MDENSKLVKLPESSIEARKRLFAKFPQPTEADLNAIGVKSNNDLVFSLRPNVLQGDPSPAAQSTKKARSEK